MKKISVIGLGVSYSDLTSEHIKIIEEADVLIGGKRHLDLFPDFRGLKKEIHGNTFEIIKFIKEEGISKNVVVIASGDPLFFGIGSLLVREIGKQNICIYPNITSVSKAFSKIKESWHDAAFVSLHGRDFENMVLSSLDKSEKVVVFTDPKKNPAWLADFLLEQGVDDLSMCVFEQMGSISERISWHNLSQAKNLNFSDPNLVLLKHPSIKNNLHLGMREDDYEHMQGLITKSEVRAVTISKLKLLPNHILWDIGAGSGSISIEASIFLREGRVFAIEQNRDRVNQIENNKKHFGVTNLKIIEAIAPEVLKNLPLPDRVFIGGSGKNLKEVLYEVDNYIRTDGIIVINTVLISSLEISLKIFEELKYDTEVVQVQINRTKKMPESIRFESENPVFIISAQNLNES
ncbi:MAG: precorrin-6y C5,15-methyltransferase (decarboxylating) subunit CbiE [Desulfobacterales bacterium]|nr:precorrin-6y C5,15-methyltransferase (decarboxylating) subunit CbiE [Desulfobacterales bacterium]